MLMGPAMGMAKIKPASNPAIDIVMMLSIIYLRPDKITLVYKGLFS
jgi:hypothetical protein